MKFILTKELGRLVKWLRILGFDTEYFTEGNTGTLIIQALRDDRIIITRNRRLSLHTGVRVLPVHSENIKEQLVEILKALNVRVNKDIMFSRCIVCNTLLVGIEREKIKDKVPLFVFQTHTNFVTCLQCNRIYWPGTHWGNVTSMLKEISLDNR